MSSEFEIPSEELKIWRPRILLEDRIIRRLKMDARRSGLRIEAQLAQIIKNHYAETSKDK